MPRDLEQQTTHAERAPDLTRPSLEGARWLALHRELWPSGWIWDYQFECVTSGFHPCGTIGCLFGICQARWGNVLSIPSDFARNQPLTSPTSRRAARMFGIPAQAAQDIFVTGSRTTNVQPEAIAQRIDNYLAGAPRES